MFDSIPGVEELGGASAAALIDAARDCSRAENIAASRKLAVLAELFDRRTGLPDADQRDSWWLFRRVGTTQVGEMTSNHAPSTPACAN